MKPKPQTTKTPPLALPAAPLPLYHVANAFSAAECAEIRGYATSMANEHHGSVGFGGRQVQHDMRRSTVRWLSPAQPAMAEVAARFRLHLLKANIGATGYGIDYRDFAELQFTTYAAWQEGHYDWHRDDNPGGTTAWDRVLSVVVLLSAPTEFEGGILELDGYVPPALAQGSLIIFPSAVRHRVTPVTRGVRHSLVTWAYGPKLPPTP